MERLDEKYIRMIRQIYTKGKRLELKLKRMDDPQAPPIGTRGTVIGVDDAGRIMVDWDDGSRSNIAPFVDVFKLVEAWNRRDI